MTAARNTDKDRNRRVLILGGGGWIYKFIPIQKEASTESDE